ncbi:putative G2/M phase checkpoint control protein Sum2 [Geopyxis carbonaria]|nr:putative G2/M phase checkpoint control protein Sum2 [Geopyxis carbonaria]
MTEFIGARISLISKSNIRYVGILHEINSETSTVALEQVVSHGTEGRRGNPTEEIAGSDNVYEYIVFRGSDVKDLRIEEAAQPKPQPPPQLDDPAILGQSSTRPTPGQFAQPQSGQFLQPHQMAPPYMFSHPPPMQQRFGPSPYQSPGMYGAYPPPGNQPGLGNPGQGLLPTPNMAPQHTQHSPPATQQASALTQPQQLSSGPPNRAVSQVPVNSVVHRSMPTNTRHAQGPGAPQSQPQKVDDPSPAPTVDSRVNVTASQNMQSPSDQPKQDGAPTPVNLSATNQTVTKVPTGPKGRGQIIPALPLTSPGRPNTLSNTNKSTCASPQAIEQNSNSIPNAVQDLSTKINQLGIKSQTTDPPNSNIHDQPTVGASNLRPRQPGSGSYSANRGRGAYRGSSNQNRKVEVPTTDYDFDAANAKFNKNDLVKEVIASGDNDGTSGSVVSTNGAQLPETIEKDNEGSVVIPPAPTGGFYNRGSSFFDNISCENKERAEAKAGERRGGAQFRSEEQKKNLETFGQGSVDGGYGGSYRGGWRGGRGRGRSYGRGRGYGGYRGGFRQQQQHPQQHAGTAGN